MEPEPSASPGTGAPHERFHFGEGRRRRVNAGGHHERAVGGSELDGSLQVVPLQKSEDEAGGEAIAATDAVEHFQPRTWGGLDELGGRRPSARDRLPGARGTARPGRRDGNRRRNYRAPRELLDRARTIADVCDRHGTTLPAAAIAFPLAHPAVESVCLGARSAKQVQRNVALFGEPIPADLWSELKATGLLRVDAPVPASPADPARLATWC
jgi:hypothetical protein